MTLLEVTVMVDAIVDVVIVVVGIVVVALLIVADPTNKLIGIQHSN